MLLQLCMQWYAYLLGWDAFLNPITIPNRAMNFITGCFVSKVVPLQITPSQPDKSQVCLLSYAPGAFRSLVGTLSTSHSSDATSAQIPWACVHAGALHRTCADNEARSTQVGAVLEQIPRMFAETKVLDSCFGGAVEAAIEVCQACWAPDGLPLLVSFCVCPSGAFRYVQGSCECCSQAVRSNVCTKSVQFTLFAELSACQWCRSQLPRCVLV